jgi:putative FmdB family regulatory protein
MPVYEYRCPDCTNLFEKLTSFSESSRDVPCPTCGAPASKLLSTFAAIGSAGGSQGSAQPVPMAGGGGGCCGGGCCGGS